MALDPSRTAVLLDRQPLWLEALEGILTRIDVVVAGKATTPARALDLLEQHKPDVFLTGIDMSEGEMDGITTIGYARERVPDLRGNLQAVWRPSPSWLASLGYRYSGKTFGRLENDDFNGDTYGGTAISY